MRRPVIGILVMVMVLVLVSGAAALAARPKVTIATYSNPRYEIMRDVLVPKWQAKHPDIELEVIIFPDFWNKMLILMGTEMAPDIIDTAGTYLFGHVIRNGAVDLAPYLAKDDYLSENLFWPGPWNEVRWPQPDGAGIYGLPYDRGCPRSRGISVTQSHAVLLSFTSVFILSALCSLIRELVRGRDSVTV